MNDRVYYTSESKPRWMRNLSLLPVQRGLLQLLSRTMSGDVLWQKAPAENGMEVWCKGRILNWRHSAPIQNGDDKFCLQIIITITSAWRNLLPTTLRVSTSIYAIRLLSQLKNMISLAVSASQPLVSNIIYNLELHLFYFLNVRQTRRPQVINIDGGMQFARNSMRKIMRIEDLGRCVQQICVSTLQNQRLSTILPLHLRHQSQKLLYYQ